MDSLNNLKLSYPANGEIPVFRREWRDLLFDFPLNHTFSLVFDYYEAALKWLYRTELTNSWVLKTPDMKNRQKPLNKGFLTIYVKHKTGFEKNSPL